jgi:hypothetical protein
MKLLEFKFSGLSDQSRTSIQFCLKKWKLDAFHEAGSESAPLLLVYQSTPDNIANAWLELVSDIAISIQAELTSEFARRNLTLIFISRGRLPTSVLQVIRENTYCCKKVVIESQNSCDKVIDAYYLNAYSVNTRNEELGPDGALEANLLKKYPILEKIIESDSREA